MELNAEQVVIEIQGLIKALKANNGWWENRGRGGWFNHDILVDALSLINSQEQRIKELAEEVESLGAEKEHLDLVVEGKLKRTTALEKQVLKLTEENERLKSVEFTCGFVKPHKVLECPIFDEIARTKADTVKEFAERLIAEIENTPNANEFFITAWRTKIDQIAKEMLEGEK